MGHLAEVNEAELGRSTRTARDLRIAELYRGGHPIVDIARDVDVSMKTVGNVVRRLGLPRRNPRRPERNRLVIERYVAGEPVAKIAAAHGLDHSAVRTIAARAGIPPRVGWQRLYPIRHDAFDVPTPVGWWLIGLLAADGSINDRENRVSLCQTMDDADVLCAFYEHVGCPERPLTRLRLSDSARERQWRRRPAVEARIFSRQIVDALARRGITARKSRGLRLSEAASREPAVWLGLFDGDGSAGIYKGGREPRLAFSGSREVMHQCQEYWRAALRLRRRPPKARQHRGQTWTFYLAGSRAVGAAQILLESSPTSMRRKRVLLQQIAASNGGPLLCDEDQTTIVSTERRQSPWQERT